MKFSTLCKLSHFFVIRCLSSKFLCSTNHIQSLSVQEKFQPVSGNVSRYLANKSTELESSTTSQHEPPAGGGSSPSPLPDPENAEQTSGHTVSTAMNEASASEPARPAMNSIKVPAAKSAAEGQKLTKSPKAATSRCRKNAKDPLLQIFSAGTSFS